MTSSLLRASAKKNDLQTLKHSRIDNQINFTRTKENLFNNQPGRLHVRGTLPIHKFYSDIDHPLPKNYPTAFSYWYQLTAKS